MRLTALAITLLTGCSYVFDDQAPEIPLVGERPNMARYPKLNDNPVRHSWIVTGADGKSWLAMEQIQLPYVVGKLPHLVARRLTAPEQQQDLGPLADNVLVGGRGFYFPTRYDEQNPDAPITLEIRSAGGPPEPTFTLPAGQPVIVAGADDTVFAHWAARADTTTFHIYQRDHSFVREVPVPAGIDPAKQPFGGNAFFDYSGDTLWMREAKHHLVGHSSKSAVDIDLGPLPENLALDGDSFISVGDTGVQRVPIDGAKHKILDPDPALGDLLVFFRGDLYYHVGSELRAVPYDGSGAPRHIAGPEVSRILAFLDDGKMVYSKDPDDRYIYGAGDGWIGDARFMERGFGPIFSWDQKHLYWLEHAAQTSGSGDLLGSDLPGGANPTPLRLVRNAYQVNPLKDGRVLALANRAYAGPQNRVIVIDEKRREARWVADATRRYRFAPNNDLLCDVVTGATGYDIVRVPVPPPVAAP